VRPEHFCDPGKDCDIEVAIDVTEHLGSTSHYEDCYGEELIIERSSREKPCDRIAVAIPAAAFVRQFRHAVALSGTRDNQPVGSFLSSKKWVLSRPRALGHPGPGAIVEDAAAYLASHRLARRDRTRNPKKEGLAKNSLEARILDGYQALLDDPKSRPSTSRPRIPATPNGHQGGGRQARAGRRS
jgi:hypothetical protein